MSKKNKKILSAILPLILAIVAGVFGFLVKKGYINIKDPKDTVKPEVRQELIVDLDKIPAFSDKAFVVINDGNPYFKKEDLVTKSFEKYSPLDKLGRVGIADSNIGIDIMPTEKRGPIGHIKPSGWHTVKYDKSIISERYLYNRCHLIGFQLAGENDNNKNLMTGTRYFNVTGMLPFENMIADYIKENKNNHVRFRVTPIFKGNELVARGLLMEAQSVEDNGAGVKFNVYCYNNQPGIDIDYSTGESKVSAKK